MEKQELLAPEARIQVLTALLNTRISVPKYTKQKIDREMQDVATGNIEITPFTDGEIDAIKGLIFLDIEHYVDGGRVAARKAERDAKNKAAIEALAKVEKEHQSVI